MKPQDKKCCQKCWHINTAYETSIDYCINLECECHQPKHTLSGWEKKAKSLMKREYLRGFINGGAKGDKDYTVGTLDKQYKEYTSHNEVEGDILKLLSQQQEQIKREIEELKATVKDDLSMDNVGFRVACDLIITSLNSNETKI